MFLRHLDLFNYIRKKNIKIVKGTILKTALYKYVTVEQYGKDCDTELVRSIITMRVKTFVSHLYERWQKADRKEEQI